MRLRDVIRYVQSLDVAPVQSAPTSRISDEPNALRAERLAAPSLGGSFVARVHTREFSPSMDELPSPFVLPADVQQPDPPVDTLAYYLPFHFYPTEWGIYLRESGLLVMSSICAGTHPTTLDSSLLATARTVLVAHELQHFRSEVACARAEVVANLRAYDAYFRDDVATAHEEALANATAFRSVRRENAALQEHLRHWMERQGPGYRDFSRWLTPSRSAAGFRKSSCHILTHVPRPWGGSQEPAEFLFDSVGRFRVPTYLVRDLSSLDLRPFPSAHGIRVIVHTRDHPPPHIHVERPIGRDYSRYEWPALVPLKGDPPLTGAGRRAFNEYLARYGHEIDAKVRSVYSSVAPWTLPSRPAT